MPHPSPSAIEQTEAARKEIYLRQMANAVNGLIRDGFVQENSFEIAIHVRDGSIKKTEIRHAL